VKFLLQRDGNLVRISARAGEFAFHDDGDTGAGKSSLIARSSCRWKGGEKPRLCTIRHSKYTPQFYEPSRGDVILNAVDARMPYWSPCDEVQHEAEAEGLAAALFKDDPRTNPFFP